MQRRLFFRRVRQQILKFFVVVCVAQRAANTSVLPGVRLAGALVAAVVLPRIDQARNVRELGRQLRACERLCQTWTALAVFAAGDTRTAVGLSVHELGRFQTTKDALLLDRGRKRVARTGRTKGGGGQVVPLVIIPSRACRTRWAGGTAWAISASSPRRACAPGRSI